MKKENQKIVQFHELRKNKQKRNKKMIFTSLFLLLLLAGGLYLESVTLWRAPGLKYSHIITAQPAYLLDKAHNYGKSLTVLPINTRYDAFRKKDYWYEVKHREVHAFIPMNYMILANIEEDGGYASYRDKVSASWKIENQVVTQTATFMENRKEKKLIVTGESNLREGAGIYRKVITKIPEGAELMLLAEEKEWYRVFYAGFSGYISKSVVKKVEV